MATTAVGGTFWRSPGWPNPVWVHENAQYLCATPYKVGEMMMTNTPPIEMRSPGSRRGLGFIATTATGQPMNGSTPMVPILPSFYGAPGPNPISTGTTPSVTPAAPVGAPPVLGPIGQTAPIFFDVNGNIISSATCGDVYGMTVPGFSGQTLHILQTKNGAPQFNGQMVMPMPNYPSVCNQDEGTYVVQAFTQAGQLLGSTTFVVNPKLTPAGLPGLTQATGLPAAQPGTTSSTTALPATTAPTTTTATTSLLSTGLSNLSTSDWLILAGIGILMYMAGDSGRRR